MSETCLNRCERCQKVTIWIVHPPKKKDIQRYVCNECGNQQLRRSGIKKVV